MLREALLLQGLVALPAPEAGTVPHSLLGLGEPSLRDAAPTPDADHLLLPLGVLLTVQHPAAPPGLL